MHTRFNPRETAKSILATTDLADPDEIAEAIFRATPKGSIAGAYRALLRDVAREEIRFGRMADEPAARKPNNSSKVAAIRAGHEAFFAQRVYANGDWKLLGDCTVADVLDLAAQRREIAAKNLATAEKYEALAERMAHARATTVRELGAKAVA